MSNGEIGGTGGESAPDSCLSGFEQTFGRDLYKLGLSALSFFPGVILHVKDHVVHVGNLLDSFLAVFLTNIFSR